MRKLYPKFPVALLALSGVIALASMARADDAQRARPAASPKYQQECSTCHIAYPANLLPASSWRRILKGLDQHYGTDASLDSASVRELSDWLAANASRRMHKGPPQDRITRSAWFLREHGEVAPATWRRAAVKSASNCPACHQGAEHGDFDEANIKVPR